MLLKKRVTPTLFFLYLCCGFTKVSAMEYAIKKEIISYENNEPSIWEKELTPKSVKACAKFNHVPLFDDKTDHLLSATEKLDRNLRGEEILKLVVKTIDLSKLQEDDLSKNIRAIIIMTILRSELNKIPFLTGKQND